LAKLLIKYTILIGIRNKSSLLPTFWQKIDKIVENFTKITAIIAKETNSSNGLTIEREFKRQEQQETIRISLIFINKREIFCQKCSSQLKEIHKLFKIRISHKSNIF
jgi:hypothetical protein